MYLRFLILLSTAIGLLTPGVHAQPTSGSTGTALVVNKSTGAILGPVSAATFKTANSIGTGGGGGSGDLLAANNLSDLASAATARTNLGLAIGTNVQAFDADLSTYAGITPSANVQSFLGAADYAAIRSQLGLVIGTNVQAFDADLSTYAGITPSANVQSFLGAADYSAMRTLLSLVSGTNVQAFDADLSALAALSGTNTIYYRSAANTWTAVTIGSGLTFTGGTLTASGGGGGDLLAANNLSDLASAATARTNLGLAIGTNVQAYDADLSTYAGITPSANTQSFLGAADYSAMRTLLGLVIGTNVQAFDADLTTWAGVTPASGIATFLGTPTGANLAAALTNESGSGVPVFNVDPVILRPNNALGALAIDVTKEGNTKTATGNHTWTFSATPSAGQRFGMRLTGHSAATTQTIPSSISVTRGVTITSFELPASVVVELSWVYDGTSYFLSGEPYSIADLSTVTPAGGDKLPLYDVSDGTDGQATITAIVATQIGTAVQAYDADLTTYAGITPSANVQSFLGAADYSAIRTLLGLVIGTNVQAYDADLTTYAGITPSSNVQSFLGAADYSAMRSQLGLVIGTNVQAFDADLSTWAGVTPGTGVATALAATANASGGVVTTNGTATLTGKTISHGSNTITGQPDVWVIPIGDETTAITTGTAKVTFRAPYAATVTAVRASLTTVSSSGTPTFDINEGGTTILSTKLTVDASEKTSTTAAAAAVISDTALADDAEITIDVDTAGTGAAGAKISIYVTR